MTEPLPEQSENTMFHDAVDALRHGDKTRAKDLLTELLRDEQNNVDYWIWLSAAVDNSKERIYCLQTALKLDPENGAAKRGLILLGALSPDENVQPFPMNRPRAWEEKLLLANEKPKERGFKVVARSPAARLLGVAILGIGLCAAVVFGFILPRRTTVRPTITNTPGPSPTFTATPTIFGAVGEAIPTSFGPTPLWMLLPATYTPTPLYVNTPRDPQNMEQFGIAKKAYEKGDWDSFLQNMELIARTEPKSADVYYYIGEAYRFKGQAINALKAYNHALELDNDFGAAYLGLARARLMQEPNANIGFLFDEAIARDPNFGEIYLERARYFIHRSNPNAAIKDLDKANQLMPESSLVYLTYADAYLALDDKENALKSAEKAYSLDITNLSVYPLLGGLYLENGQYDRSAEALELYVTYESDDARAFALLGQSYYEMKKYDLAVTKLNRAFLLNPNGSRDFYVYRGLANFELNNVDKAVDDLEKALDADATSFDVNLGLTRGYFIQEKFGSAFLSVEALKSLAKTDEQTALALYWRALVQEKRGEQRDATRAWKALLAMDANAMTPEMRLAAEEHLKAVVTPTSTPKGGAQTPASRTPTPTP